MRSGFEYFRNFEQDAMDFAGFTQTKLRMPMLVMPGEKASGRFLIEPGKLMETMSMASSLPAGPSGLHYTNENRGVRP